MCSCSAISNCSLWLGQAILLHPFLLRGWKGSAEGVPWGGGILIHAVFQDAEHSQKMQDAGQGISETQQVFWLWEHVRQVSFLIWRREEGARLFYSSRKHCLNIFCGSGFLELGGILVMCTVNCWLRNLRVKELCPTSTEISCIRRLLRDFF